MSVYTIRDCLLQNVGNNRRIIVGVLYSFADESHENTLAVDTDGRILDIYSEVINSIETGADHLSSWLSLVSHRHDPLLVKIPIGKVDDNNLFIEVAANAVNGRKMIIDNYQDLNIELNKENSVIYKGEKIEIYDKNKAATSFKKCTSTLINNNTFQMTKIKQTAKNGGIISTEGSHVEGNTVTNSNAKVKVNFHRKSFGLGLIAGVLLEIFLEYVFKSLGFF